MQKRVAHCTIGVRSRASASAGVLALWLQLIFAVSLALMIRFRGLIESMRTSRVLFVAAAFALLFAVLPPVMGVTGLAVSEWLGCSVRGDGDKPCLLLGLDILPLLSFMLGWMLLTVLAIYYIPLAAIFVVAGVVFARREKKACILTIFTNISIGLGATGLLMLPPNGTLALTLIGLAILCETARVLGPWGRGTKPPRQSTPLP
jgi:hypothetical protein